MTKFHVELFIHLLGVFALLAGAGVAAAGGITAQRGRTAAEIVVGSRLVRVGWLYIATPALLVIFGAGMALSNDLDVSSGATWIWVSLILWVALLGVGHAVLLPRSRRLAAAARAADPAGPLPESVTALQASRAPEIFGTLQNLMLIALLVMMVWQPS